MVYDPLLVQQPEPGGLTDEQIKALIPWQGDPNDPHFDFCAFARAVIAADRAARKRSDEEVARIMAAVQFYGDQRAIDAYCRGFNEPDDPSGKTLAALSEVERLLKGEA